VKLTKGMIALFLVALWLPATSHAFLESAGFIHQEQSSSGSADDRDHDVADGICASPASSIPVLKGTPSNIPLHLLSLPLQDPAFGPNTRTPPPVDGLGPAPPYLPCAWQFLFRAALPARAPSFLS